MACAFCALIVRAVTVARTADSVTIAVEVDTDVKMCEDAVAREVTEPFVVDDVHIFSDAAVDGAEISYLVGFGRGSIVDAKGLARAISYILKKEVFQSVRFVLKPGAAGTSIDINLCASWLLGNLKVSGVALGKDTYRAYYALENGERFDIHKHRESIEKIESVIRNQGFLDPRVKDTVTYESHTKTVHVALAIDRGPSFAVGKVDVDVDTHGTVSGVEYENLVADAASTLTNYLVGKKYSKNLIDERARSLRNNLVERGFLDPGITLKQKIIVQTRSVDISFFVDIHGVRTFEFTGNTFFSRKNLLEILSGFGRAVLLVPPAILAQEIASAYKDKGFVHVRVGAESRGSCVYMNIDEGHRDTITKITLAGVVRGDVQKLSDTIVAPVLVSAFFDASKFHAALRKVVEFYHDEGFFDATASLGNYTCSGVDDGVHIVVAINEGKQYYVGNVIFDPPGFPRALCPAVNDIDAGVKIPCTQELVARQRQWIASMMAAAKNGPASEPRVEIARDEGSGTNTVTVTWHIGNLQAARVFGKTVLVGTRTTAWSVIERELCYHAGDPFNLEVLTRSAERLRELDVFDAVNIYPEQTVGMDGQSAIIVKAQEAGRCEMRLRAGIGLQQMRWPPALDGITYKFGASCIVKNPTQSGDQLRCDVDLSRARRDIMAVYKMPWLFGLPVRSVIQGYSTMYDQPGFFAERQNWYNVQQHGFLAGLTKGLQSSTLTTNIGLEWVRVGICQDHEGIADRLSNAFVIDPCLLNKNIPYVFCEPTAAFDRLDEKLDPTSGSYTLLSCKAMSSLSAVGASPLFLLRCLVEQSFFVSLKTLVVATRIRAGYVFGQNIERIPLNSRFYLGGAHSLRSYYTDSTPPVGTFIDEQGCRRYVPQGGKALLNASVELRVPLSSKLKGVIFQDVGSLGSTNLDAARFSNILTATGVGLWYDTPLGPLRFDAGFKWPGKEPFRQCFAWFLSLGHAF